MEEASEVGSLSSCTVPVDDSRYDDSEKSESICIEAITGSYNASATTGSFVPIYAQTATDGSHETSRPLISREGLRKSHSHYLG